MKTQTIAEKLKTVDVEKSKNQHLFDCCGFQNTDELSTHMHHLSCIVLSCEKYDKEIDEFWGGNIVKVKGFGKIRELSTTYSSKAANKNSSRYFPTAQAIVKFASGFDSIQNHGFSYCSDLEELTATGITSVGAYGFYQCTNLKDVDLKTIQNLQAYAFSGCTSLSNVELDTSVLKYIQQQTFSNCSNLVSIDLSEMETIDQNAFRHCKSLKDVGGPLQLTCLNNSVFLGCSSLTSLELPNVTVLSDWCMSDCRSLVSVYVPNLKTLGYGALNNCTSLSILDKENTGSLRNVDVYTSIHQPNDNHNRYLTQNGYVVFAYPPYSRYCRLTDDMKILAGFSYRGNQTVETISCSPNFVHIFSGALMSAKNLKYLDFSNYSRDVAPNVQTNSFDGTTDVSCIVPDSLYESWSIATNWNILIDDGKISLVKASEFNSWLP